jgi:acyl-coenzyme A thioesterase PaaI-like protein
MSDAFQDRMPRNHCFGCGADNPDGLQIKSRWSDDPEVAVCRYEPRPHQKAGPDHVLNGGIIATLIDCHGICTAVADAYRREGRQVGQGDLIWCVTASIEVRYRAPTAIDRPLEVTARVKRRDGRKTELCLQVISEGKLTAEGDVLAVRVPPEWLAPPS